MKFCDYINEDDYARKKSIKEVEIYSKKIVDQLKYIAKDISRICAGAETLPDENLENLVKCLKVLANPSNSPFVEAGNAAMDELREIQRNR